MSKKWNRRSFIGLGLTSLATVSVPLVPNIADATTSKSLLDPKISDDWMDNVIIAPAANTVDINDQVILYPYQPTGFCIVLRNDSLDIYQKYVNGNYTFNEMVEACKYSYSNVRNIESELVKFLDGLYFYSCISFALASPHRISTKTIKQTDQYYNNNPLDLFFELNLLKNEYHELDSTMKTSVLESIVTQQNREGSKAVINPSQCSRCGSCYNTKVCPVDAIQVDAAGFPLLPKTYFILWNLCIGCGACLDVCCDDAIHMR